MAEAGLAQGFEYLLRQRPDLMEDDVLWARCDDPRYPDDTAYPCGAVTDATYDHDADPSTAPVSRRSTMFRLVASGHTDTNFAVETPPAMLRLPNKLTTVGAGFPVAYGVAPLLC